MKIDKILILTMVVTCLFFASTTSVVAIEENEIWTDITGDVFTVDLLGIGESEEIIYVTEHPDVDVENIDIVEVTYSRENKNVDLTLKVDGIIEDRGELIDIVTLGYDNIDAVGYTFLLSTSNEDYTVSYANNKCQITYSDFTTLNLTEDDFSIDDLDTLVISFELNTDNETYDAITIEASYIKMNLSSFPTDPEDLEGLGESFAYLLDVVPNPPLEAYAMASHGIDTGVVGVPIQFNGTKDFGEPPYSYLWDFGDGKTSTQQNPTHIYTEAGEYTYNFTVTDNADEQAFSTGIIEILAEENGTPGFEMIIAIAAIGLILLWKRRKIN